MPNQLETALLKKTPCNGCRERKRKCSYEQPCARCVKFKVECTYTVMPSPKDIEYIQELEHMKQIELIQHQITCMENEMSILKLARDNMKETHSLSPSPTPAPITPPTSSQLHFDNKENYHDYPPPVSISSAQDLITKRSKKHDFLFQQKDPKHAQRHHGYVQHYLERNNKTMQDTDSAVIYDERNKAFRDIIERLDHEKPHVIAKSDYIEAAVTENENNTIKPWTLTVKNGNMSIETHISSHAELMSQLRGMIPASIYQQKSSTLPFPLSEALSAPKNMAGTVLGILIWRKYGKSRFKSMMKYTPTLLHYEPPNQLTKVSSENISTITMRLVYTYFQCLHMKMLYIHIPTFIRLFMTDEEHVMNSPVVLSLCSVICHQACKHLNNILPNDALSDYGLFYFEQARELISEQFDEANWETLLTYTYMALYQIKTKNDREGNRYLCIAERIYNLLLPQYKFKDGVPPSDEAILFSRVYRGIHHLRSVIHLHDLMDDIFKLKREAGGPSRLFKLLDNESELDIYTSSTDLPLEIEFIKMKRYHNKLREAIQEGAQCAASEDFPTYISVFGHHIEMAMRHWYRNVLPPEFQLSLPLFEDDTPDIEFFTKLESECGSSPMPILATLDLYNEYLIMAKSYIPKNPRDAQMNNEELLQRFKNMQRNIPLSKEEAEKCNDKCFYWLKVIEKMLFLKQSRHHSFTDEELELSDEEYFTKFIMALNPSEINFDMPFIHTSIRTALNMVRIIQFLLSRDYSCYLDLRWVLNAWEVLLRAARFRYQQPGDEEVTLDRVRANLILCVNIIRDQINNSRRDASGSFVEELEQKLEELF